MDRSILTQLLFMESIKYLIESVGIHVSIPFIIIGILYVFFGAIIHLILVFSIGGIMIGIAIGLYGFVFGGIILGAAEIYF